MITDSSTSKCNREVTLAITGASGVQYALRLLECLVAAECRIAMLMSSAARIVLNTETEHKLGENHLEQEGFFQQLTRAKSGQIKLYTKEDWFAPVASGSSAPRSMVICPASGGTIAAIANGMSNNLIERAADVAIKERRQLIVVPRETPVSTIHLENQLKLSQLGVVVLPASPGYYAQPKTIDDLIDFVVARILDQLGIEQKIFPRWGEED